MEPKTRKWLTLGVVCVGMFMGPLDGSIMNVANPTIAREWDLPASSIQWAVIVYMLTITTTLLMIGKIGDHIGAKPVYAAGFLVFALGSLGCSQSPGIQWLVAARAFQAIGASMMMSCGLGLVVTAFPPQERGRALGISSTVVAIAAMCGPALGGFIIDNLSWQWIFLINVPIGVAGFIFAHYALEDSEPAAEPPAYDIPGALLWAAALCSMLLMLGFVIGHFGLLLGVTAVLFGLLYTWEKRQRAPLLDFELFSNRGFMKGNMLALITYGLHMSVVFSIPFFLQNVALYGPAETGLLLSALPLAMGITAPQAGRLSDRYGSRQILMLSYVIFILAFLLLSQLQADSGKPFIILALGLEGMAMGAFASPNNSSIFGAVPFSKVGYTGGFVATVRNLAFSLGVSVSTAILSYMTGAFTPGSSYEAAYTLANHYYFEAAVLIAGGALLLAARKSANEAENTGRP